MVRVYGGPAAGQVTLEAPALAGWQAARVDLLERNPAELQGQDGRWQWVGRALLDGTGGGREGGLPPQDGGPAGSEGFGARSDGREAGATGDGGGARRHSGA